MRDARTCCCCAWSKCISDEQNFIAVKIKFKLNSHVFEELFFTPSISRNTDLVVINLLIDLGHAAIQVKSWCICD